MGASAWISFVKAYHKKHGGSFSASLKAAAPLWRKQKGKSTGDAPKPKKKGRRRKK